MQEVALRFPTVLGNRIHNALRGLSSELAVPNYTEVDDGKTKRIALELAGTSIGDLKVENTDNRIIITSTARRIRVAFGAADGRTFETVEAGLHEGLLQIRGVYRTPGDATVVEVKDGLLDDWDASRGECDCGCDCEGECTCGKRKDEKEKGDSVTESEVSEDN